MTDGLYKSVSHLAGLYNDRFEKLLVSRDEAINDAGRKTSKQKLIETSEQNDSRRLLLVVEELANKKKEVAASAENAYLQYVETNFHESLLAELHEEFTNTPMIMEKILKIEPSLGRLLDVLYTEACSISRLVDCLDPLPWLQQSLVRFVRQPKYRRVNASGKPVILKTVRSTLSFVGIESLRTLIPVLIAKHANPIKSEFAPDLAKHMWMYTIGTGNLAKAMAEKREIKSHFGYNVGLFSNFGRSAVVSIYLRAFDAKLREEIIKARTKNDITQAQALGTLLPSYKYIISLWKSHADLITTNVIKTFNCRWLMLATGFEDYAKIQEINIKYVERLNLHPFAKLLFSAQGFMQYKMLYNEKLMGKQEAMIYLRNFGITSADVAAVSKINLTGIELNIAGVIDESENDTDNS